MMAWTVYKITCNPNGKLYIGITRYTLKRRWGGHASRAGNFHTAIANAIAKYGRESFEIEALAVVPTLGDAVSLEREFIAKMSTMTPHGYNMTSGGEYRKELSADARSKIAAKARGRLVSAATRAKMSASQLGRAKNIDVAERRRRAAQLSENRRTAKALASLARRTERKIYKQREAEIIRAAIVAEKQAIRCERSMIFDRGRALRQMERVAKIASWHRGRKRSASTRAKISAAATARIGIPRRKNPSGVAGVWFDRHRQLWRAQITINKDAKSLGRFRFMEDAITARRNAESRLTDSVQRALS